MPHIVSLKSLLAGPGVRPYAATGWLQVLLGSDEVLLESAGPSPIGQVSLWRRACNQEESPGKMKAEVGGGFYTSGTAGVCGEAPEAGGVWDRFPRGPHVSVLPRSGVLLGGDAILGPEKWGALPVLGEIIVPGSPSGVWDGVTVWPRVWF